MSFFDRINYKLLSLVLVIALVVALVAHHYLANATEKDLARLDRALASYYEVVDKGDEEVPVFSDKIKSDLESLHGSIASYASQKSLFTSALIAYTEKNNKQAIDFYSKLLNKHSSSYLSNLAALNLAYLQEDEGKVGEALTLFSKLAKKDKDLMIWSEATFNVARLCEKDDLEKSVKLYKELVNKLAEDNVWLKLAENRLISLAKL